jgi:hypothetical protein
METNEMNKEPEQAKVADEPLTLSVPAAGKKYYGLSRAGSYAAAKRGEIPTIKIGRLIKVPVARMNRLMLTGE